MTTVRLARAKGRAGLKGCVLLLGALLWAISAARLAGAAENPPAAGPALPGVADPEWDLVFQRREGWTGGDAAYSIDLGDDRILWLFADSWIGRVDQGKHTPDSRLVNNAIALHKRPVEGKAPSPNAVQFRWGTAPGVSPALAWIRPPAPEESAPADASWYWVADGIVAPGAEGSWRLVIFLWQIERTAGPGIMNFRAKGGAIALVDNFREGWEQWKVRTLGNPHATSAQMADKRRVPEVSWGSELLLDREADTTYLYVYGCHELGLNKQLVLARVPAARVEDFEAWQFRGKTGWTSDMRELVPLAGSVPNEYSVSRLSTAEGERFVLVHSEPLFGPRIMVRVAETASGPWSPPRPVFRVPDLARNKNYFTYAAKAHPELSRPGELLLTYIVNSFDFGAAVNDAEIYHPRFVRLPLKALPAVANR